MLESGDFINISLGDGPRYEKPVGIYWLQAASTAVFGSGPRNQIWTYRIPSLLGALAAVAATFFLVRLFAGVEAAFTAGLLLGMSVLLMSEAKIAKTDAVLARLHHRRAGRADAHLSQRRERRTRWCRRREASCMLGWAAFALGRPHQRACDRARVRRVHHRRLVSSTAIGAGCRGFTRLHRLRARGC